MIKNKLICVPIVLAFVLNACNSDLPDEIIEPEKGCAKEAKACVLFDQYHARKQNFVDYKLDKNQFVYVGTFAFGYFANHLQRNNYYIKVLRDKKLSDKILEKYNVLFINLVDNTRPDFEDDEVKSIIKFVKEGGGLFVIADHTNVYDHAERINKFLKPMGVEVLYYTAAELDPSRSIYGKGWFVTGDLSSSHPVTAGVKEISLQTGGPITVRDKDGELAFTSDKSFGDLWDKSYGVGYYGDWAYNKSEGDIGGPLNVYAAAEYGKGRIVVAGDQNMFGDPWIFYTDNFEIAMNSMEWAAKREEDSPHLREKRVPGLHIGIDQTYTGYLAGGDGNETYMAYLINSNRDQSTVAHGSIRFDERYQVYQFGPLKKAIPVNEVEKLNSMLRDGATVIVGFTPKDLNADTMNFLSALDSSISWKVKGISYSMTEPDKLTQLTVSEKVGRFNLVSDVGFELKNGPYSDWTMNPNEYPDKYTSWNKKGVKGALGQENEASKPFLYEIKSDWGENLIETEDHGITVARRKKVGEGELIVFFQDGMLRGRSLGNYLQTPNEFNRPQIELNYALLDYLKRAHNVTELKNDAFHDKVAFDK